MARKDFILPRTGKTAGGKGQYGEKPSGNFLLHRFFGEKGTRIVPGKTKLAEQPKKDLLKETRLPRTGKLEGQGEISKQSVK